MIQPIHELNGSENFICNAETGTRVPEKTGKPPITSGSTEIWHIVSSLEKDFLEHGGLKENMFKARIKRRDEQRRGDG